MLLLIDDLPYSRLPLVHALTRAGYDVREAATGREGLRLARHDADIVVLDAKLPDMNGFEVCRLLKNDRVTSPIPVIMYSAYFASDEAAREASKAGADAYLARTENAAELLNLLQRLTKTERSTTGPPPNDSPDKGPLSR
jgi:two-component system NtrC family sensor kinase